MTHGATTLLFDTLITCIVVICSLLIYLRTRKIYSLSLQKGIRYFSLAFLYFIFCFLFRYLGLVIDNVFSTRIPGDVLVYLYALLGFLTLYFGWLGGFYLSYSLMWRKFEHSPLKRSRTSLVHITALAIALGEILLTLEYGIGPSYLFFISIIALIFISIHYSRKCLKPHSAGIDPYLTSIGLAFGIYLALFLEGILFAFIPTVQYYVWVIVSVFMITMAYNVAKLSNI